MLEHLQLVWGQYPHGHDFRLFFDLLFGNLLRKNFVIIGLKFVSNEQRVMYMAKVSTAWSLLAFQASLDLAAFLFGHFATSVSPIHPTVRAKYLLGQKRSLMMRRRNARMGGEQKNRSTGGIGLAQFGIDEPLSST